MKYEDEAYVHAASSSMQIFTREPYFRMHYILPEYVVDAVCPRLCYLLVLEPYFLQCN